MAIRSRFKDFLFLILKSLHPRYYIYLADRQITSALLYFLVLLVFSFLGMSILAIPQLYLINEDIEDGLLEIAELRFDTELETASPVLIPSVDPFLVMDTTGGYDTAQETLLLTDQKLQWQLAGTRGEINVDQFDLTSDRTGTRYRFWGVLGALLPSIFTFYFFAYALKYALTIMLLVLISYPFQRIFKNITTFSQSIVLALHTGTVLVLIEILTIPFSIVDKYLLMWSFVPGMNFSLAAVTLWFILYATAVRITGNQDLR